MSVSPRPIGRTCLVQLLPSPKTSTILEVVEPEKITQRGVVTAVGPKCKWVEVGQTYILRVSLGVTIGDLLLVPEVACMAKVEA